MTIIQRFSKHIDSFSGQLEDGFLHELSSEILSVISESLQDEVSVPGLSMRDLQPYGTLLSREDIIDPSHHLFHNIFLLLVQFFFQ
jgi:hypothetical protein